MTSDQGHLHIDSNDPGIERRSNRKTRELEHRADSLCAGQRAQEIADTPLYWKTDSRDGHRYPVYPGWETALEMAIKEKENSHVGDA